MSAGLPTTRYEDQGSPVLYGLGRAAQTLLELGPKLGQIKLEKDRLALDKQREGRVQHSADVQESRQAQADERAQIEAAPGNYRNTPSPFNNALAEQTETVNAAKGIRPSDYQEGLPRTPQKGVPISGFAAALDVNHPGNPFTAQDFNNNLEAENLQNEQSHKPVQSRAGATYEDTMSIRRAPSDIARAKAEESQRWHDLRQPSMQQTADAATTRADKYGSVADQRHEERIAKEQGDEENKIKARYKINDPYGIQTPQEKQANAQAMQKELAESRAKWNRVRGVDAPTDETAPANDEEAMLQKLIDLNKSRKATP